MLEAKDLWETRDKQNFIPTLDKFMVWWKGRAAQIFLRFNELSATGEAARPMKPPSRCVLCQDMDICAFLVILIEDLNGIAAVSTLPQSEMTICSYYSLACGSLGFHEIRFLRYQELPLYLRSRTIEDRG